jgi:mannose-1-phosphate guanylyltransferase
MVVTGKIHAPTVQIQLPDLALENLLAEPSPKESAAAIGLAAAVLARRDPEAVLGSFAADHMISGAEAFMGAVTEAVAAARHDYLVTIGIAPSHPSTGFGYVRLGRQLNIPGLPNTRIVSQFKEKPDARTAAAYISSGNYRWNAGMFVVKARVLMALYAEYCPELAQGLEKIADVWDDLPAREKVMAEIWPTLPKIAIDNAVAEPAALTGRVATVPATFGEFISIQGGKTILTQALRLGRCR